MGSPVEWRLGKNRDYDVPVGPVPPHVPARREVLYVGDCVTRGCEWRTSGEHRISVKGAMVLHAEKSGHRNMVFVEHRVDPVVYEKETGEFMPLRPNGR